MATKLKITQIGSPLGRKHDQRETLQALGLDRMHRSRTIVDNPSVRGMLRKVAHLIRVEPAQ